MPRDIFTKHPGRVVGPWIWPIRYDGFDGESSGVCYLSRGLREAEHREALTQALRAGCNVIDTSTNYMDGESEQLVGSVLQGLMRTGDPRTRG